MSRSSAGNTFTRMQGVGGTIAERKFEELYPHKWLRMGFDRPDWSDGTPVGYSLPKIVTAMPDYLARNGEGPYWVEVKGCKGNLIRSVKVKQLQDMIKWEKFSGLPVYLFVWNSSKKRWLSIDLWTLSAECYDSPIKAFHDGPEYYELQWSQLEEAAKWTGRL